MIPSSNLLAQALTLISPTPFQWLKATGRAINGVGLYVTTYSAPISLMGSIQAVSRSVYQQYGLDFQKQYINIFVSANMQDISRGRTGDMVVWNGRKYQLTSETAWFEIDGWISVLAVEVDNEN